MANELNRAMTQAQQGYDPNTYKKPLPVTNGIEPDKAVTQNLGVVAPVRAAAAGVMAGANEIVAAGGTVIAKVTDNKVLQESIEATRNENDERYKSMTDDGIASNIAYGLGKYLGIPGLSAATATAKAALPIIAGGTGAISYQETKQDLINQKVDRDTANEAGIMMGAGMALTSVLPVAGIGVVKSLKQGAAKVGISAGIGVGAMTGTTAGTGVYVQSQGYQTPGQKLIDAALTPESIGIGLVLGGGFGAVVARSKYKSYQSNVQYINNLNRPVGEAETQKYMIAMGEYDRNINTPEYTTKFNDIQNKLVDPNLTQDQINALRTELDNLNDSVIPIGMRELSKDLNIPVDNLINMGTSRTPIMTIDELNAARVQNGEQPLNQTEYDAYVQGVQLANRQSYLFNFRMAKASTYTYSSLKADGILTDSDRNIILNNERILREYAKTGDYSLIDQLEIPQVHRDIYALEGNYNLDRSDVKAKYFDIDRLDDARATNKPYIPEHVNTISKTTPSPLSSTIGRAEGDYRSFNRGNAGDSVGQKMPTNLTVKDVMDGQNSGQWMAVGKYQFIPSTLKDGVKALNIDPNTPWTPELQELLFREYLIKIKRKGVYDYITKDNVSDSDLVKAQLQLAQEFASVGIPRDIGSKKRGQSYYAGVAGNKASISPDQIAKDLIAQRKAYQESLKESISDIESIKVRQQQKRDKVNQDSTLTPLQKRDQLKRIDDYEARQIQEIKNDAWESSFDIPLVEYSKTVTRDVKGVRDVQEGGQVFKDDLFRTELDIPVPSKLSLKEIVTKAKDVRNLSDIKTLYREVTGINENTFNRVFNDYIDKGGNAMGSESKAIQAVYEQLSYQHALKTRQQAIDMYPNLNESQLSDITLNAFTAHQENLKIGKSKIFNEEYTKARSNGLDEDAATIEALTQVDNRVRLAAIGSTTKTGYRPQDEQNQQTITTKNTAPDNTDINVSVKGQSLNGKKIIDEQTITAKGNKNPNESTSTIKLDDGTILTRISTRLPNGRVRNVYIDSNGNRTAYASATSANDFINMVNKLPDNATVNINGKQVTKQEIQQLLALNGKIDDQALNAFASCALTFAP